MEVLLTNIYLYQLSFLWDKSFFFVHISDQSFKSSMQAEYFLTFIEDLKFSLFVYACNEDLSSTNITSQPWKLLLSCSSFWRSWLAVHMSSSAARYMEIWRIISPYLNSRKQSVLIRNKPWCPGMTTHTSAIGKVSCAGLRLHVVSHDLNLANRGLVGQISPSVGNLTFLKHLFLPTNAFTGEIPTSLGNLHHLQTLNLSNNMLQGRIPSLTNCSKLM